MNLLKLIIPSFLLLMLFSCGKEQLDTKGHVEAVPTTENHSSHEKCIFEGGLLDQENVDERHRRATAFPIMDGGCFNVFITTGCSNTYTQATIAAIAEFNAITNTSLELTVVNSQSAADIIILCEDLGGGDCNGGLATATTPIEVRLHTGISTTNCFCNDNAPITLCDLQFIAMHELGHAIGFHHTDLTSAPLITGTPVNDFFSVFNSGGMPNALCAGLCEFTTEDINAIRILYPGYLKYPNFDIAYNAPVCLGDVVNFTITPLPSNQTLSVIDWYIQYGGLNIMSENETLAVVEALSPGASRICATVENNCGNVHTYCTNVTIQTSSNCTSDGDIPNPQ